MTEAELIEHIKGIVALELSAEVRSTVDETRRMLDDIRRVLESYRRALEEIHATQQAIKGLAERGLLSGGTPSQA